MRKRVKNEDIIKDAVWLKICRPFETFAFTLREIGIGCFCAGSDAFLLEFIRTHYFLCVICYLSIYIVFR